MRHVGQGPSRGPSDVDDDLFEVLPAGMVPEGQLSDSAQSVFEGLVTSCSEDGLSFRAQRPLKPGQTVFIRIDPDRMVSAGGRHMRGCLKSMCLAEVLRCRKNADAIGGYAVSAKYLQPCY
jgi:hypothetical protein